MFASPPVRVLVAALAVVVLTLGCASDDDAGSSVTEAEQPAGSEISATTTEATASPQTSEITTTPDEAETDNDEPANNVSSCQLLDNSTIESFAGSPVASSSADELGGVPRCVYEVASGGQVQVVSVDSTVWASQLPDLLALVEQAGPEVLGPDGEAKLAEGRELLDQGAAESPDGACRLFSLFAELQGLEAGADEVVNYVPTAAAPLAVNGQRCRAGRYSSVQLQAAGIVDDQPTYDRTVTALDSLHDAGLAAGS